MQDSEDKETELELAGVFVYLHGNKPVVDFLFGAIETKEDGCIPVNSMMETSVPGVFCCRRCHLHRDPAGCRCSITGMYSRSSAERYLYKRKKVRMDWAK